MATTQTIATFTDRNAAESARENLTERADVDAVRLDDPADRRFAKAMEVREESTHASPLASTPVMTGSAMRASLPAAVIGAVIGFLLVLPLTFLLMPDFSVMARLATALAIGVVGGGVGGWLTGGYLGATVSTKPLVAERGAVVGIPAMDDQIDDLLTDAGAVAVGHVAEDGSSLTVVAADHARPDTAARHLGRAYAGSDRPDQITDDERRTP